MRKLVSIALALAICVALAVVVSATPVDGPPVVSDTATEVYYAGYDPLPTDWNTPGFDDSSWSNAVLYQHSAYLDPTTESPFVGTGAEWISYAADQATLPDYTHPSMNLDGTTNFATYLFRKDFQVPATAYNASGSVGVAADNYGWLYLNGDPSILGPKDAEWGYNFRPDDQNTGSISAPSLECENVLAARVENGAKVSGTDGHGPMGLLFLLDLDYEIPDAVWQPPITNSDFALKDGTTLPLKFKLYQQGGTSPIDSMQDVYLTVYGPSDGGLGPETETWNLGDGIESLRWNDDEDYYIANFQTRNYTLVDGATYTAVVHDGCTDDMLGNISFVLSTSTGTGRGNSGK